MPRDQKRPANTNRKAAAVKPLGAVDPSPQSARKIQKIVRKGGNEDFARRMGMRAGMRDQMLAFVCERLRHVHGIQQMEHAEIKDVRTWFRSLARGRKGVLLPDTTRWHECASLYKRAGQALALGHVDRGAALIEKAMEAERAAMESAPKQVKDDLTRAEEADPVAPAALGFAAGATFAIALAVTGRRLPFEQVTVPRVLALGVAGGAVVSGTLLGAFALLGGAWPLQYSIGLGISALLGGGSALAMLQIARRGRHELPPAELADGSRGALEESLARETVRRATA